MSPPATRWRSTVWRPVLIVSNKTVRNTVSRIYAKLHANGRAEAIVKAREAGFGKG